MVFTNDALSIMVLATGNSVEEVLGGLIFFSILLIAVGLTSVFYPRLFWYLRIGRKVKDVEPSPIYLWVLRFGGLLVITLGIFMIYYTF